MNRKAISLITPPQFVTCLKDEHKVRKFLYYFICVYSYCEVLHPKKAFHLGLYAIRNQRALGGTHGTRLPAKI